MGSKHKSVLQSKLQKENIKQVKSARRLPAERYAIVCSTFIKDIKGDKL